MKLILTTIVSIMFIGLSYSQNCIDSHTGKYNVNMDATTENLKKVSKEKGQEISEEELNNMTGMLKGMVLTITPDTLVISFMGRDQKMPIKARVNADGSSCDMVLVMTPEQLAQLPEGTNEMFMTINVIDKNSMMLISTGGSADMDVFVWSKSEK